MLPGVFGKLDRSVLTVSAGIIEPACGRASGTAFNSAGFAPFWPRMPWIGPDLQTVRNAFTVASDVDTVGGRKLTFTMPDGTGDSLTGMLSEPSIPSARPLVILIHGLAGCERSPYVLAGARYFLDRGYPVLRLNLRGAGPIAAECRERYHAGRFQDLEAVLDQLTDAPVAAAGVILIGYSLGGSILLCMLAHQRDQHRIRAAVSISAPINLAETAERFLQPRNWLYHRWLIRHLRRDILAAPGLSQRDIDAIVRSRTIVEIDERFVAPRNGFAGARDYYRRCSALQYLDDIRIPTLMIHALDDPWIPGRAYSGIDWHRNPCLNGLLPAAGGHVGFHDADGVWSHRMAGLFVDRLGGFAESPP